MPEVSETTQPTISYIQTDTFCDHCHYNLHGRPVTRDERLGILIMQCPECGAFLPAGHTTTASKPWLNRLTTLLTAAVGPLSHLALHHDLHGHGRHHLRLP